MIYANLNSNQIKKLSRKLIQIKLRINRFKYHGNKKRQQKQQRKEIDKQEIKKN